MTGRPPRHHRFWLVPALAAAGTGLVVTGIVLQVTAAPAVPAATGSVPTSSPIPARPATGRSGDERRRPVAVDTPVRPVAVLLPGVKQPIGIVAVGTTRSGVLQPPDRIASVGWWRGGAALGDSNGSLVLAGHVDDVTQGLGAFAALRTARPGQPVRVRGEDGRSVRYRITGLRSYPRNRALPAEVFDSTVGARLVMITCTGVFDRRTAHYSDSLVVFAVPQE